MKKPAPWNRATVKAYMLSCADEHIDNCGEVDMTNLAEDACQNFNAWGPYPNYNAPDEFFDWAFEVTEEWEKGTKS